MGRKSVRQRVDEDFGNMMTDIVREMRLRKKTKQYHISDLTFELKPVLREIYKRIKNGDIK